MATKVMKISRYQCISKFIKPFVVHTSKGEMVLYTEWSGSVIRDDVR